MRKDQVMLFLQISCRGYYFSETITGTEVVIIFFFQSLLRACTKKAHDEAKWRWKSRVGERNRLVQHLTLKAQNIACDAPTFFGTLSYSSSFSSSFSSLLFFSNHNFFREYGSCFYYLPFLSFPSLASVSFSRLSKYILLFIFIQYHCSICFSLTYIHRARIRWMRCFVWKSDYFYEFSIEASITRELAIHK